MTPWRENILFFDEVDSTNTVAKAFAKEKNPIEGTFVAANFQTGGRGQKGNTWYSSPNKNLLFSGIVYPNFIEAKNQFIISKIAALSVKNSLKKYTQDIQIKWPNDIYWKDSKIAGILIENDLMDSIIKHSIIGMGININEESFPDNLPNPVSLSQISNKTFDSKHLLNEIIDEFQSLYENLKKGMADAINTEYMQDLYHGVGYYEFLDNEGPFEAKIQSILPSGELVLEKKNGESKIYAFKEVQFVLKR